ncbi:Uncharacterised protein [Serratia rubidaea]|uniref:Uncharacterized protein n=1 Tax=Serratia rubidaea TaxID=61652 RepID=A0A4U9HKC9_SERRU|nr:Uncharacterised protein [Serratia rubidaea]
MIHGPTRYLLLYAVVLAGCGLMFFRLPTGFFTDGRSGLCDGAVYPAGRRDGRAHRGYQQ